MGGLGGGPGAPEIGGPGASKTPWHPQGREAVAEEGGCPPLCVLVVSSPPSELATQRHTPLCRRVVARLGPSAGADGSAAAAARLGNRPPRAATVGGASVAWQGLAPVARRATVPGRGEKLTPLALASQYLAKQLEDENTSLTANFNQLKQAQSKTQVWLHST